MAAPLELFLERPTARARCAVLILGGSSGRVETERVRLLARHGAIAASLRWFGGWGQPPGICEVPVETFRPAIDRLAGEHDHLVVMGSSKGAEVALLLAAADPRITTVVAMSPSSVVWANVGPGHDGRSVPQRSSWTSGGIPLPFVPYDPAWVAADPGFPAFRGHYARSLELATAELIEAATIPVERISGQVLLSAGGDDQVWPSDDFCHRIVARRSSHGLGTRFVSHAEAGHRVRLPGEPATTGGMVMARGGSEHGDAGLGSAIWAELVALLDLRPAG